MADVDYLYENPGEELHVIDGKAVRLKAPELPNMFDSKRALGGSKLAQDSVSGMGGSTPSPMAEKQARKPTPEEMAKFAEELEMQMMVQEMQPSAMEPELRMDPNVPSWLESYMNSQPTTGTQVVDRYGTNRYLTEQEKQKYKLQPWKRN